MPLSMDGSNLTEPYWFKRCCEWLFEHGYTITLSDSEIHHVASHCLLWGSEIQSSIGLAPASMVSAVYRHMQEGK